MKKKILIIISVILFAITILPVLYSCGSDLDKASKDLCVYNIDAKFDDETMTLNSILTFEFKNTYGEPVDSLCFHLYGNSYRKDVKFPPVASYNILKAYPNGLSYGAMEVLSVKEKETDLEFNIGGEDKDILYVNFENDIQKNETKTIKIEFSVKLANVLHRLGYGAKTINLGNWYPILCFMEEGQFITNPYYSNGDPFYSDMANYNIKLELSKDYKAAFSGNVNKTTTKNDKIVYEVSAKTVRDFAMVFSKDFETVSQKYNNTTVTYYYYDDENPNLALEYAVNAIKTFSEMFGEYPYESYNVVKTNFIYGGMEYPNMVLINDNAGDSFYEIIVHETAHQWWYGVVGNDQLNEAWIDEGLAEYSTALFFHNNPQYNKSLDVIVTSAATSYKLFVSVYMQVIKNADTTMNRRLDEYTTEYEYVNMVYNKGMILFDEIRKTAGYDPFIAALKKIYTDCKYGFLTEGKLKEVFATMISPEIPSLMDSFILGRVIL